MAVFKCKMCGGTIEFEQGATVGVCDSCGTKQTLPTADDDAVASLYNRANVLRLKCEFDKAEEIYNKILEKNPDDAEAHWGVILCKYGIEYVEDPKTYKRVPTCHRTSFEAILADADYKAAMQNGDAAQRELYAAEAKEIDRIQKDILAIVKNEKPFDVFICYKETDEGGKRTADSAIANDIYYQLTEAGFKVFYAAITLEDKLGQAYEPYIFAALNSAKVMLAVGTKPEYFEAVWVKNEWSRFLKLMKTDRQKLLIPCYRDMDAYELPEEFAHLQAQDMSKIGFINDIVRGVKKVVTADNAPAAATVVKETVVTGGSASTAPLLKRAFMFLEDGDWNSANEYCEKVLDIDPECAEAYLGKLMAELGVKKREDLADCAEPFDGNNNYQKAVRFGNEKLASTLKGYIDHINERNEEARLADIYKRAMDLMKCEWISDHYSHAAELFKSIPGYKDADALAEQCAEKVATAYMEDIYDRAQHEWRIGNYEAAIDAFKSISGFRDADEQQRLCQRAYAEKQAADEARAKQVNKALAIFGVLAAVVIVFTILYVTLISPALKRSKANQMLAAGDYANAYAILQELGDDDAIVANKRSRAEACLEQEKYNDAYRLFKDIGDEKAISESKYNRAIALLDAKAYDEAYTLLKELGDNDTIVESKYSRAMQYIDAGDAMAAALLLKDLDYRDSAQKYMECLQTVPAGVQAQTTQIGDTIFFGAYEQDNDTSNGKETIEWMILAKEDNRALLISKYGLDCQPYHTKKESVTWETCSLRKWLNNDFLNAAFSDDERTMIPTVTVSADKNPEYSTDSGNATQERVFLLSITEAEKYFSSDSARQCKPTKYAIASGAYVNSDNGNCWLWLRSPGGYQFSAAIVNSGGSVSCSGGYVNYDNDGVRPALWINLES